MVEVVISLTILGIILGNIVMLQSASANAYESGVFGSTLEDSAESTMDRIALAVMSTRIDSLDEVLAAPGFCSEIDYEVVLDVIDGEPVFGAPEKIEFLMSTGQVMWTRDPESPEGVEISWSRYVSEMLEGEVPNGVDDNGNGIADEQGLAFNRDVNQIMIRLTLTREDSNHVQYTKTKTRRVTCRN